MPGGRIDWEEVERKIILEITGKEGYNVNRTEGSGTSLIHLCCQVGMTELCRILLQNHANIHSRDVYRRTPLMIAAYNGFRSIVELLLSYKARIEDVDIYGLNSPMHAIYAGDSELFKLLCPKESTSYLETYVGSMSYLAFASALGRSEIAKLIITEHPDTEILDRKVGKSGMTPLMLAICCKERELVKMLMRKGADVEVRSNAGLTAPEYGERFGVPLKPQTLTISSGEEVLRRTRGRPCRPLTPNIYLSPFRRSASPRRAFNWIRRTIRPKRSRSLDNKKKSKISEESGESEDGNLLKSIFQISKMEQYWPLFKEQEINFKTFLTMNEDDLQSIGILKASARLKLLTLIDHYKKIFNSK